MDEGSQLLGESEDKGNRSRSFGSDDARKDGNAAGQGYRFKEK